MVDGHHGQNGIIATSHAIRGRSAERDGVKTPPPCTEVDLVKGTATSLLFAILKYVQVSVYAVNLCSMHVANKTIYCDFHKIAFNMHKKIRDEC